MLGYMAGSPPVQIVSCWHCHIICQHMKAATQKGPFAKLCATVSCLRANTCQRYSNTRHPRSLTPNSPTDQNRILESRKMGEMGEMQKNGVEWAKWGGMGGGGLVKYWA